MSHVRQHVIYGIIISHMVHMLGLDSLVFVALFINTKEFFFAGYVRHLEVASL